MQTDLVKQFVADLIKEAGIDNMPASFKADYIDQIGKEVEKRIGLLVLREIKPEQMEKLDELVTAKAAPETIYQFLTANIADYEAKMAADLQKFRADFIRSIEQTRKSIATS